MHPLVNLAKSAVEAYIREGEIIFPPEDLAEEFLNKKAGIFVTIEKKSELRGLPRSELKVLLRGCIGTYLPTRKNIAEEIIHNAIAAASEDYRFGPIQKNELPHLCYTVYILGEPELIKELSSLNPKKYGIIVKTQDSPPKCGLLLPDLEGIDTTEEQISIACQKGGINPEKEKVLIYKFATQKYQ